ncbi:TIGR03364 family FAD-dependent oxidoreductase [Phenylobacterium sp.]|uniref:TIGR03364 family FAD-dependent oxidoreductase n=1 Tax=Phenylobacterium sp. TaxID=1871053 RepID=UPI00289CCA09|nr:TIGR03364 family FAD-dependent oxidoreductase [Phenylobacterium sp.]
MTLPKVDLVVVGTGVVGLSCALAAARLGKRVAVVDRDAQANGASVRNFGFITVTGQARGEVWNRARRTRDVWKRLAAEAGVTILQRGLWMTVRRPEARAVLEAFMGTEMGDGCALLTRAEAVDRGAWLTPPDCEGVLWSPHDLRVDSRTAIPRLAAWMKTRHGVTFLRETAVLAVEGERVVTSRGVIETEAAIVCPGDDLVTLYPDRFAAAGVVRSKLQMMRLADPGFRAPAPLMSDLGLVRYAGYADLPEAAALRRRLETEQSGHLRHGVHLIAVQNADGSLVVGDSHHEAATPDPFGSEAIDRLILDEFAAATGCAAPPVIERWTGAYAKAADRHVLVERLADNQRLVVVTSGNGASTGFALGEEVVADLYGRNIPE